MNTLSFWEKHSLNFLEMAFKTERRESLSQPHGYGRKSRECGDTIEIFLTVRDGVIESASFETNGCIYSVACANTMVHLAMGKSLEEAGELGADDVIAFLETLPSHERHCAELAADVLRLALMDARETKREPWKRYYRSS